MRNQNNSTTFQLSQITQKGSQNKQDITQLFQDTYKINQTNLFENVKDKYISQQNLQVLIQENQILKKENENLKKRNQEIESQLTSQIQQICQQDHYQKLNQINLQQYQQENNQLKVQYQQLNTIYQKLKNDQTYTHQLKQDLEKKSQQLQNQNEDLKSQISTQKNVVTQLNFQNQELQKEIYLKDKQQKNIDHQYQKLQTDYQEIYVKFQQLQNKNEVHLSNNNQINERGDLNLIKIKQLESKFASKEEQYQNIYQQNNVLNNEIQQLKKTIDPKNKQQINIDQLYQELQIKYQEIYDKFQQLQNKNEEYLVNNNQNNQKEDHLIKIQQLESKFTSKDEQYQNIYEQNKELEYEIQQLQKKIDYKDKQKQNIDNQYQELYSNYQEMYEKFQQLQNKYEENRENSNLNNKKADLDLIKIQQLKSKFASKDKQYQIINQQYNELYTNYQEIQDKYQKLQNDYQELKENKIDKQFSYSEEQYQKMCKYNQDLEIQYNEKLINLQQNNSQIENQYTYQQQLIEKLKSELTIMRKQNLEQQQKLKIKQVEQNQSNDSQVSHQEYDLEIKMQSILDLENCQEQSRQIVEKMDIKNTNQKQVSVTQNIPNILNESYNIIGFLGERNKGKTFILNSLINQLPVSTFNNQISQGISIKYQHDNDRNMIFIDHIGFNQPAIIDWENNSHYINYIQKKDLGSNSPKDFQNLQDEIILSNKFQKITELIQQGFIVQYSQILILVVSNINQEVYNYTYSVFNSFGQDESYRQKKIIVLHNLKHINKPEYVETYIQEIKDIFPLRQQQIYSFKEPQYKQNSIFIDKINNNINHLIMANENSQAGDEYNKFAIDYLREQIVHCKQQIKFDVIQQFKNYLNQNIQSYLTLKCNKPIQDLKNKDFIEYDQQKNIIQLKKEYHIEKVKYLQMNLGISQSLCQYSIVSNQQNNKLFLLVNIPNSAKFEYDYIKNKGLFQLKIFQNHEIEQQLGTLYISNRKLEEEYQIYICKENELYKQIKEEYQDLQNGIHQFVFMQDLDIQDL
ncbi:hypothetical protein ABPG74_006967 [Tetrahymena malaccensis]